MNYITLNNGVEMPAVGYGVYQVSPDECVRCVEDALHAGYRLIDTAQSYDNEYEVGQGLRQSGVVRGDIFLTTKSGLPMPDTKRRRRRSTIPCAVSRLIISISC